MSNLKLGKLPATHDSRDFKLSRYLTKKDFKTAPVGFGHAKLVQSQWGMLGNDYVGDCAIAGPMHATMLWNAAAGHQVSFTTAQALKTYSAITGYDPRDPNTDQGTNMRDALKYRQKYGLVDANGVTHKIGAYISIDPKNTTQLLQALYLGEAVEIGFEVPESAMTQFDQGKPWTVSHGSQIVGGHDIPIVGRPNAEGLQAVTWGQLQNLSFGFYKTYNDEAWVCISEDMLNNGKSLEGFDLQQLQDDLSKL